MAFTFDPSLPTEPATCADCHNAYATGEDGFCDGCREWQALAKFELAETAAAEDARLSWTPDESFHTLSDADYESTMRGLDEIFRIEV